MGGSLTLGRSEVASILRTDVKAGFLSRRDNRTEPGVLTPGTDKKTSRPEGGGRTVVSDFGDVPKQSVDQNILRPFRAPPGSALFLGLKPQAESYSPFGTSLPQNQKAGQKLRWIPVHIFEECEPMLTI
jgi:hypothetical protein